MDNIFTRLPNALKEEVVDVMIQKDAVTLERIVSQGQATPKGEWLQDKRDEWVVLLLGKAGLMFQGSDQVLEMKPGDHIKIPADMPHRVEWTDSTGPTVWLAVYY